MTAITLKEANKLFREHEFEKALQIYIELEKKEGYYQELVKFNKDACIKKLRLAITGQQPDKKDILYYSIPLGDSPNEFDVDYYLKNYPDVRLSKIDPLNHFLNHGYLEGRNPNASFNINFYLKEYPDVRIAGINPFVHWIQHGKNEGRKINEFQVDSIEFSENQASIIFLSHEASMTGAPAVLISLIKWIKENTSINYKTVLGTGGPLISEFKKLGDTFVCDESHTNFDRELKQFCGNKVQCIFANTVASGEYIGNLDFLGAKTVAYIHEMKNVLNLYTSQLQNLEDREAKFISCSPRVTTDLSEMISSQPKEIKPFIQPIREDIVVKDSSNKEFIVYGCGTVEQRKGFDFFCECAKIVQNQGYSKIKFKWIGGNNGDIDPYEEIKSNGVKGNVEYLGVKNYPRELFIEGSIFFLPSREDPFPLVCLEAADCSLPIICFDEKAGGMHTFVKDNIGFVIPYADIKMAADKIIYFYNNPIVRKKFGQNAKRCVTKNHYSTSAAVEIFDYLPIIHNQNTINISRYVECIDKCEVISFDIFDTLITRSVSDPMEIFNYMQFELSKSRILPVELQSLRFTSAGQALQVERGKVDDITLSKIYEEMPIYQELESTENNIEVASTIKHPIGRHLYEYALKKNKKIVYTSDMYLEENTIKKILRKNNYSTDFDLYLSSAYGKKKETGRLFLKLSSDMRANGYQNSDILHIGDNYSSDYLQPRSQGIKSLHFPCADSKSFELFPIEKELKGMCSLWNSMVSQHSKLFCLEKPKLANDFFIRCGMELAGPFAMNMALHVKNVIEKNEIDLTIFMARDGRIIMKAFDALTSEQNKIPEYKYLSLSRATVISATLSNPLNDSDIYFLTEGALLGGNKLRHYLEKAGLNSQSEDLNSRIIDLFGEIDPVCNFNNFKSLSRLLRENSSQIYSNFQSHRNGLLNYLKRNFSGYTNILLVDVGWLLNIHNRLKKFCDDNNINVKLKGAYIGSSERSNAKLQTDNLIFTQGNPHTFSGLIQENVTLFELLFSAPEASAKILLSDTQNGYIITFKSSNSESLEYLAAQKMHFGAEHFFGNFTKSIDTSFALEANSEFIYEKFKALVHSRSPLASAYLNSFNVLIGGDHNIKTVQNFLGKTNLYSYTIPPKFEYFEPIYSSTSSSSNPSAVIVTSAGLDNGSTRYRALHLCKILKGNEIDSILVHCNTPINKFEAMSNSVKVIIFQRCFIGQGNVEKFIEISKRKKINIVFEIDDLIFPAHIDTIGSVKGGEWDRETAVYVARKYEEMVKLSKKILCSTTSLRNIIKTDYNKPALVYENAIDIESIEEVNLNSREEELRSGNLSYVYMSGTKSHCEDFRMIELDIYQFFKSNSDANLTIIGSAEITGEILALKNTKHYPLLPYTEMLIELGKADILLVPLVNSDFNNCKSAVKYIEASALGKLTLASPVTAYSEKITSGINGMLVTDNEWMKALKFTIENRDLIKKMSAAAYHSVINNFSTNTYNCEKLNKFLNV